MPPWAALKQLPPIPSSPYFISELWNNTWCYIQISSHTFKNNMSSLLANKILAYKEGKRKLRALKFYQTQILFVRLLIRSSVCLSQFLYRLSVFVCQHVRRNINVRVRNRTKLDPLFPTKHL